jgi:hypothetical protein
MIVRTTGDGNLLLITQPDHARLAATLISAWEATVPLPAALRGAVLYAIEQHDNGWQEVDAAPMWNAGSARPYDFVDTPADVKRDIWPRGIRRVAEDSPLAAALVAQHALTLHAQRRSDPSWTPFFSLIEDLQASLLRRCAGEMPMTREVFDRSYDLLHVGDVLSLVFCNRWKDPFEARGYRITLDNDDDLVVSPDPFNAARVRFEVAARTIPDRAYRSDAELHAAFREGRVVTLPGTAAGAVTSPR